MGGVMNGLAKHGGVLPVGGTFLVFSDYMRGSVRLAALSQAKVIYSWTHDSVGVGEDGPTHQPVEHVAALRAMPQLRVIRPADANETAEAWQVAVDADGPTALILSRQNLPVLEGTAGGDRVAKGGYVLHEPDGRGRRSCWSPPGSEVWVCVDAAAALAGDGVGRPRGVAAVLGALRRSRATSTATRAPAGLPTALGRGGHHLRLGSLRRRLARHRPLRRQRAGRGRAREVRLHPRQRRRPGPGP